MEINIFNLNGINTKKNFNISDSIIKDDILAYKHLLKLEIVRYLSSKRQGTSKTKERSNITGSSKKLQKQKGTGNSRKGDVKNPIFRGGGRIFGPKPRDYDLKMNKYSKLLVKKLIISHKLKNDLLMVVDDFNVNNYKTSFIVNFLKNFNLLDKKILFIQYIYNKYFFFSARNIKNIKITCIKELNNYDLLNYVYLLFEEKAIVQLQDMLIK
jgi:large subunit ribosomal protein L4